MKKHITILTGILLVFMASLVKAQTKADDAVLTTLKSIREKKNVEITFNYRILADKNDPSEEMEGKVYLQGEAYKLLMKDQENISDGKTVWSYFVEDQEVMVGNMTDDNNPFKLIEQLEQDASGITPIVDSKNNLKGLEIILDEGGKLAIDIKEMKFDQTFPKDFFEFDEKAYPEVEVIDMR